MTPETELHPLDRLPRWVPATLYAVLTLLVFRAYLPGSADNMLVGQDTIAAGVMFRSFFVDQVRLLHRIPLWNPFLFGGVPYLEAGGGDTLYPTAILHFLLPMTQALAWKLIVHVFLAGVFMYLLARAFGARRWIALLIGSAHLLSANLVSLVWGGQDGKMYVITLFPAALWLLVTAIERRSWIRYVWLGAVCGLILIAHPQLAFYAWLALGIFGVTMIWHRRAEGQAALLGRIGGGIAALAVAIGVAAILLFPMYRYLRHDSTRIGRDITWSSSYSMHWEETVGMFLPDFAGVADTYWGKNPLKHNLEYGGTLILLAGLAALWALRGDRRRWGLLAMALVPWAYGMGLDTPVFRVLYALVPPLRNFRAPSLAMFVAFTAISLLAALAFERGWGSGNDERTRRLVRRTVGIGAVVALVAGLVVQGGGTAVFAPWTAIFGQPDAYHQQALAANVGPLALGAVLLGVFGGLAWGAMLLAERQAVTPRTMFTALIALVAVNGLRVDSRYIEVVKYTDVFPDDQGIASLRSSLGPGERVLVFPAGFLRDPHYHDGYLATYRIPEVFGYHGNQLKWYDLYTRRAERESGAQDYWIRFLTSPALEALSARYAILPPTSDSVQLPGWQRLGGNEALSIFRSERALAGGAVLSTLMVEPDTARQLDMLWTPGFDVRTTAVVSAPVPGLAGKTGSAGGAGTFRITGDGADTVAVDVTTSGPAFFLLSRNWHYFWHATVDGAEVPVVRADYTLMGVPLAAAGTHHVVFRYRSPIVDWSTHLTVATWALVLVVSAIALVVGRRRPAGA